MNKTKLAIIGSGPSGLTAAIYASRAMLEPVLFAGTKAGGQLMFTTELENFPGFPKGVNGPDFMIGMREQATRFGTKIVDEDVQAVDFSARPFKVWTNQAKDDQHLWLADSIIISTGATAIMLGIPGEDKFFGRGVSSCAVCDAAFFKDKDTLVIGGGDAAMEDAVALTKFAKSVKILHRRDQFKASKIMQDRVLNNPKIEVIWNTQVTEVLGDQKVTGVKTQNTQTQQAGEIKADGVFLAIGHKPMTSIFQGQLELDSHGYVVTRQSLTQTGLQRASAALNSQGLVQFPTMTNIEGVFAAGDVVDVRYKQAVTAAGQGTSAALDAEWWLEQQSSQIKS